MALSGVMHSGFLPPTEAKPHICAGTAGELPSKPPRWLRIVIGKSLGFRHLSSQSRYFYLRQAISSFIGRKCWLNSRKQAKDLSGFSTGMRRGFPDGFSSHSSEGQRVPGAEGRTRTVPAALSPVLLAKVV